MTETTAKRGVPTWVWILSGCGCLGFGGVIVLGILAAIALPSFLNQANKAKEAEAKTNVGSILRAQQAYVLERGKFTTSLPDLQLGITPASTNYSYKITMQPKNASQVTVTALSTQPDLKSFAGAVFIVGSGKNATTVTQLCQTEFATQVAPTPIAVPASPADLPQCPPGSRSLSQ
jgi:type IV pilus assembly protein PilA